MTIYFSENQSPPLSENICLLFFLSLFLYSQGKFTKNENFISGSIGALSRMVKIRGACDKPFWVSKRLNKLRRCRRAGKLMC